MSGIDNLKFWINLDGTFPGEKQWSYMLKWLYGRVLAKLNKNYMQCFYTVKQIKELRS